MVDMRDFPDPELVEDRVKGGAFNMLFLVVEKEADRWRTPARILVTSLRYFVSIPRMVCCCFFFVFVLSQTGWRRRKEGGGERRER